MLDYECHQHEDSMPVFVPDTVVNCRGRASLHQTNICRSFTARDLDKLAPIPRTINWNDPTDRDLELIDRRMKAAWLLKYGECREESIRDGNIPDEQIHDELDD